MSRKHRDEFVVEDHQGEPVEDTPLSEERAIYIIGNGPDFDKVEIPANVDVMCINGALGKYKGSVKYFASRHDLDDITWRCLFADRASLGSPERIFTTHSGLNGEFVDINTYGGGSTLLGVLVASTILGYTKIIVVNSPLTDRYEEYRPGWEKAFEMLKDSVKALGGYPEQLFGKP